MAVEYAESPEQGGDEPSTGNLFLGSDDLPEGLADTLKPGDVVRFKVVGRDADGDIEVEYATEGEKEGEGMDWRDEMRQKVPSEGGY